MFKQILKTFNLMYPFFPKTFMKLKLWIKSMQQIGLDLNSYSLIISNWKVIKIFFPSPVAQCSPYSVLYEKNNQIEVEEEKRHYWLLLNSHIIKAGK